MRDKYEISVWEDKIVAATDTIPAHFEEEKIAVIGSNTMTSNSKAFNPQLVENINGSNTFTFKMYYTYMEDGKKQNNPFLSLLINERKIKVFWKEQWYDFVIKSCQEDSSSKSITYTCKDIWINELSKTGFNLEFDTELENNQGTVLELAEKVLENTDWQLNSANSDIIQQTKQEPVYECTPLIAFTAKNETKNIEESISDGKLLVFYSCVQNESLYCQFLYAKNGIFNRDINSQLITNTDCYSVELDNWNIVINGNTKIYQAILNNTNIFKVVESAGVSSEYRGERLVRSQQCVLDTLTDKYCYIYKAQTDGTGYSNGDIIYEYRTSEYKDPTIVNNLIVNPKDFSTTEGWLGEGLFFQLYPTYKSWVDSGKSLIDYTAKSYLKLSSGNYYNSGARESSSYTPNGFQAGEKYIFRYKARTDNSNGPSETYVTEGITPRICEFTISDSARVPVADSDYFTYTKIVASDSWVEYELTCIKSISRAKFYNSGRIGFFLISNGTYWLEEVQLYPLVYGQKSDSTDKVRINPGEMELQSIAQVYYKYFNNTTNASLLDEDELDYLYVGTTPWNNSDLVAQYNDNFVKIRSITAKNSNRFNLLQTLAETFECWCKFTIQHNQNTGRTIYIDGKPQKFVSFVQDVGEETGVGFIYGIDLKTISRSIDSDQIVTKTIVTANNNEYATDGFCTIARSQENYARDTFILNFDYYINQGLLSGEELNKDLYLSSDSIGYYYNLNKLNTEYDELTELIAQKENELLKQEALETVYENYITSLQEQIQNLETQILQLCAADNWTAVETYVKANPDYTELISRMGSWQNSKNSLTLYAEALTKLKESITLLTAVLEEKKNRQTEIQTLLKTKHLEFYNKYSRFIQEGSWTSEDYIDDDLYYLDAQSVAYTSSRPQISYNISVIRISGIKDFENKIFHLGDISFIQDTEFFGYTYIDQIKTPYKEKVLVSEVTSNFDSPEQDTFKVQNYKSQFEDLFQRITSTTQSLQYASGEYARAANAIESTGIINPETLQSSISLNADLVYSAQNDSVLMDSTGLTVADATNPNKKTKLTSGGIFITTDGGTTWKNAVRGEGIATQYLTAGAINTNSITLLDGVFQSFRWDSKGINAFYDLGVDPETGLKRGINLSKFVRFDHFGIYGIDNGESGDYVPTSETQIWEDAKFGLTWNGFFLKNKYNSHYVEVSSTNDIQVVDQSLDIDVARIKIGKLDTDVYGIRISDINGNAVLETPSDGKLWLQKELNIASTDNTYSIKLGYLDKLSTENLHRTIDINDNFIVYEDGSINAKNGTFTGLVYANGGKIGNLSVDDISGLGYQVQIESSEGTTMGHTGDLTLTAHLYHGNVEVTSGLTYQWLQDGEIISGATEKILTVNIALLNKVYTYKCNITYTE